MRQIWRAGDDGWPSSAARLTFQPAYAVIPGIARMGHVRRRISDWVKRGLHAGGTFHVSRRLQRRSRAVILRYHSVSADVDSPLAYIDPGLSVPMEAFD